jgi:hypothetical protein
LPKFSRSNAITVEDHLNAFLKFVIDLEIEHEDVVMKMFVQTLEGDARAWYKALQLAPSMDGILSKQSSLKDGPINRITLTY